MPDDELNLALAEELAAIMTASELVLQEVEPELAQSDTDDFSIVEEPAPKVGFVKRWTRKVVGWVKRVIKWAKE